MLLIKEYTKINSVSGNEDKMRRRILDEISSFADSVTVDTMGNIIALKKGTNPNGKKTVVSAHMDEVGLIITDITDDGFLKFASVGGIDPRILLAQRVVIGDSEVCGVVGIKAVHLQKADERKRVLQEREMYIDIGASSKEEAQAKVKKGDYAAFDSEFRQLGGSMFKAKALDDRVGCAILTKLIKQEYESDIYFCFCVQEEVGLRGARVISRRINADAAIVLEGTTCSDIAGQKPHEYATVLGGGPVLSIMDRASYSDKELNKFIENIARENSIAFQYKKSAMGGNDAGAYQTFGGACKTAVISLPCRYIHSPVSCADENDYENMKRLAGEVLKNIQKFSAVTD